MCAQTCVCKPTHLNTSPLYVHVKTNSFYFPLNPISLPPLEEKKTHINTKTTVKQMWLWYLVRPCRCPLSSAGRWGWPSGWVLALSYYTPRWLPLAHSVAPHTCLRLTSVRGQRSITAGVKGHSQDKLHLTHGLGHDNLSWSQSRLCKPLRASQITNSALHTHTHRQCIYKADYEKRERGGE